MIRRVSNLAFVAIFLAHVAQFASAGGGFEDKPIGIFENHQDIGVVARPGLCEFDLAKKSYTISGAGENMWVAKDAFQFAWKKATGDLALVGRHRLRRHEQAGASQSLPDDPPKSR